MGANGFSIREYTCKMRSVDVFNCWPFSTSSNVTRQDLQSWLPPMSLPPSSSSYSSSSSYQQLQPLRSDHNINQSPLPGPSRSFHDDYGSEQSDKSDDSAPPSPSPNLPEPSSACDDEKSEMVCPVCREFNAATLTAVNAHMDGCLAQSVREDRRNHVRMVASTMMTTTTTFKSSKSKAPKKRSIAEIFKVQQEQEKEEDEKENEKEKEEEEEEEEEKEPERIESVLKLWKKDSGGVEESVVDEVSITVTKFRWLSRRLEALRSGRRGAQSDGGAGISAVDAAAEEEDEEKSEMVCPVCRDFNAATVTAVNAHIDNCLAQAVRDERRHMRRTAAVVVVGCSKQKPKAPKKRSIAEILTVAPPIGASKSKAIEVAKDDDEEAEEDNGDEDKSDYSALDSAEAAAADADAFAEIVSTIKSKQSTTPPKCTKKTKTKKLKKKSKVEKHGDCFVSLNSGKKMNKNKKKKRKKSFFNNEMTSKKEDACKRKVQTSVHSSRKLKVTIDNKMVTLHGIDPSSTHEKKLGSKMLLVEKKQKVKNCDPIGKQQKEVSPVRGILKNHFKQVSGKTSSSSNTQDGTDEYHCDDELFTCKDDVLGPKKRNSFDETMFNKSSDVLATSLVKEQSSESDEESASLQTNRNYDYMAFNIDKRKEICSIVDSKEFSSTLEQATNVPNFLKPCTSEEKSMVLEENSETLTKAAFCDNSNLHLFDGGDATTSHCSPYADISIPLSTFEEVKMPGMNVQVCESGSLSSIRKFIDHLEDPKFHAARENSYANTRTFLEPSSSYSASYDKGNERPEFPLQTHGDNDNSAQASCDRQLSRMFGSDMTDNSFSYTGLGKGSVRSSCQNANFFGLPLNSHGDLINFSSSGKLGTNQLETSSTLQGSLSGIPVNNIFHQGNQENLSINERHVVQNTSRKDGLNPFPHYPARLAVSELPCSEREDIHRPNSDMWSSPYVKPLNSEMDIMRSSSVGHYQHDWVLNHQGNGTVSEKESSDHVTPSSSQPTMRLMGKDVPIGRSTKAVQQIVGDNWADDYNRRQHYSEYSALENSFSERCSKQDWISGSSLPMSIDNVVQSATIRNNQALPSSVLMNGPGAEFPRQFTDPERNHVSQNGSLPVSRNASSYFHPIAQEHPSCAVFNGAPDDFSERFVPGAKPLGPSSQSQVQATPCNFSQPACFSNGELNERYKSPHVTKLASEFPFLPTAVDEQAKTSWFQRSYRNLPSWLSNSTDERLQVTFSPHFSGLNSQSFSQNSWGNKFTSPSANHSAEVLYPSNPLTSQLGSMKTTPLCPSPRVQPLHVPTDRLKLDNMMTKDHHQHPCTNTRKRPASALDDCRKPIKLPNIEVQENMSRMTARLTGENSSSEMQRNTRPVKHDPHVDGARSRCCQNEAQKLNPTSYPALDSFKLDSTVTSGPVRLDPRAKHILRSS